ncbi:acetoacetate--CoA ligase [Modestobacter excelsi]|uniref:acetoacetate--CoA ligase n=1 Tax=Modestobacter excelsi TaxID=2213161 RepID=UPI00110D023A|nr:acetoacetate--CoA ligase [Modestobacter excelsi]
MTRVTLSTDAVQRPAGTQLADFRTSVADLTDRDLTAATALHAWSVESSRDFWRGLLRWSELAWEGSADVVCTSDDVESAVFFPGVRLNYAENLLRPLPRVDDDAVCLTSVHGDGGRRSWTRRRLRDDVAGAAAVLAASGLAAGGRAVVVAPNNGNAVVAALATAALGAAVASAMPDMGPAALLGRFTQVEPTLLLLDRGGRPGWAGDAGDVLHELLAELPSVGTVLVLDDEPLPSAGSRSVSRLADRVAALPAGAPRPEWPRQPFNDPLFVMFSSGTTGPPKAMVHGIGGTLLEHVKEHRLHGDLRPDDRLYFHTTTAWMMWNWQLSALAVGASIVLFDGVVQGPQTLWELAAEEQVTVFGTSPAHLQLCQDAGYRPADAVCLPSLRAVLSTGAVLHDWQFDWFADAVGPQPLQSISGGTDIIGCFVLGHPELPVVRGRSQSLGLGLDVAVLDDAGDPVLGEPGELVCRRPFPSRPVRFLRDADGTRLHRAYFAQHPGVWTHGDVADLAPDGTLRVHGRSDGVLNIDGIRIGPAEIYQVLRGLPEIEQSVAVEQRHPTQRGATRLVLLVKLLAGAVLDGELETRIRSTLRQQAGSAHVPALVLAVPEVPLTHSGKTSESAVRDTVNGDPVANTAALRNPGSLAGITAALEAAVRAAAVEPLPADDEVLATVGHLWHELGVDPHDGIDDFFDLGGTSRQSMTLLRRVQLELGADVPVEQFLADPTIPGVAAAVRRGSGQRSTVVQLAPGDPTGVPLFFVHDAWGDVEVYRPLAEQVTGTGPVHGVRADLLHADGTTKSVHELAVEALAVVRTTAQDAPLHLAGFSFGGLVAFEMARLSAAEGRPVEFLGLLDTLPPLAAMRPVEKMAHQLAGQLSAVVPGLADRPLREVLQQRFRPDSKPADRQVLDRSGAVFAEHRLAPYAGPVTYFRARLRVPVAGNVLTVWRRAAPDLTVEPAAGSHHDLLAARYVGELGSRLSAAVRRATS